MFSLIQHFKNTSAIVAASRDNAGFQRLGNLPRSLNSTKKAPWRRCFFLLVLIWVPKVFLWVCFVFIDCTFCYDNTAVFSSSLYFSCLATKALYLLAKTSLIPAIFLSVWFTLFPILPAVNVNAKPSKSNFIPK